MKRYESTEPFEVMAMDDTEIINKFPLLLGHLANAPGNSNQEAATKELLRIRRELPESNMYRKLAEFNFKPKKMGVSWKNFLRRYRRVGPPSYFNIG